MRFNRYTKRVNKIFEAADTFSSQNGYEQTGSGQILWAMLAIEDGLAYKVLNSMGLRKEDIQKELKAIMLQSRHIPSNREVKNTGLSKRMKNILAEAANIANNYHTNFIASEHLLLAITKEETCVANIILANQNIDIGVLRSLIFEKEQNKEKKLRKFVIKESESKIDDENLPMLNKYGINMVKYVVENNVDPLLGRNEEINRIMQILNRRKKNNPMLIGEPGVGKTAIVEGIARKLAEMKSANEELFHEKIYSLEVGSLIAGTKYRGEFEERLQIIIDEVANSPSKILLFIDEIHTLVGAGSTGEKGSINAADILKPALSRGDIQIIGATTMDEYRMYIERDSALERRFQIVQVAEADRDTSIYILKGIREKYELYHKVKITDEAIEKAVDLSIRYIADRRLPDKAIDLIDESCSRVKLKSKFISQRENLDSNLALSNIKDDYFEKNLVTGELVAEVVGMWTGIPMNKIMEEEAEKLLNLERVLCESIVGQDHAEKEIARAIRRSRTGIQDPHRPIGSFLFVGPAGVGKTELSKVIAEAMFEGEENFIRLDMSEYMEKHSVSKIIGSPPGYVGHEEGGYLTEKVRFHPYSVVLFDEMEKAHKDISNLLLQILDEGSLTDSKGRKIDFKNTIVIMTSNIGYKSTYENNVGFSSHKTVMTEEELEKEEIKIKEKTLNDVKSYFSQELLNRIDEIVVFKSLRKKDFEKIVVILSKSLIDRAKNIGIELEISESVYKYIADYASEMNQGARLVKRIIQNRLTNKMSEAILKKNIGPGDRVYAYILEGKIEFEKY